jgi:hypothetical protein
VGHSRPAEPTAGPAKSAFTRLRPNFALQQNFVMCHHQTVDTDEAKP